METPEFIHLQPPSAEEIRAAIKHLSAPTSKRDGKSVTFSRSMLGWILIFVIGGLCWVFLHNPTSEPPQSPQNSEPPSLLRAMAPTGIVVGIVLMFLAFFVQRTNKSRIPQKVRLVGINKDGVIHVRPDSVQIIVKWINYTGASEIPEAFVLHTSPHRGDVIPKRNLSAEQLQSLRSLLLQREWTKA